MLDEDDKIAINKAMDAKTSKVIADSEVKKENDRDPTDWNVKIKTEIENDEICGNIGEIVKDKSEENVAANEGGDTIVVDGNIVMEPLESEEPESYPAGESSEFLLASDLEPSAHVAVEVEESTSEEYTPNVVEVDVSLASDDLTCPICDMTFTLKKSVRRHVKNIHKIYKDPNETTTTTAAEHISSETEVQDVQDGRSQSTQVSEEGELRKETAKTISETIYKCEECGEEQSWKDHYKHVRIVHDYSAKAAIKSVARTKKRIAEEKVESTSKRKKTCWVGLVKFDDIPYDELPSSVGEFPIATVIDENSFSAEEKVDEVLPGVVKRKTKSCEVCHLDVSHANFNRHVAAKHGESTKKSTEPSTKDEVIGGGMNEEVGETSKDLEQVKQSLRLKAMKLEDKLGNVEEPLEKNTNNSIGDVETSTVDSSERTVCKLCNIEVSASYLRRHLRRMHKTKLEDLDDSKLEVVNEKHADIDSENDLGHIEVNVLSDGDKSENTNPSKPSNLDVVVKTPSLTVSHLNEKDPHATLTVDDSSGPPKLPQDSGVFLEKLKLKLLLDSDDEDEEVSEPTSAEIKPEKEVLTKEATEDRKTIIENLKPNCNESKIGAFSRTSRNEFEVVKDPNLPPNWMVRYTWRPDLNRTDREYITPDKKRMRSIVKMLEYMSESKQYTPEEIERVKEYFKKPRVSLEHLKSLEINNS